jgi:AcrR family transcriptional regulator
LEAAQLSNESVNQPRKRPQQARSEALVNALLGALARILNRDDLDHATSNEIARQAGVSIGSFYQYFPNKRALLTALVRKRAEADISGALAIFAASREQPLEEVVQSTVGELISHHRRHLKLYRVLLGAVPSLGQSRFVRQQVATARQQFRCFLDERRPELRRVDSDVASFVLGVSIEATLHAAILERPELLDNPEFERSLVDLCTRYLIEIGVDVGTPADPDR